MKKFDFFCLKILYENLTNGSFQSQILADLKIGKVLFSEKKSERKISEFRNEGSELWRFCENTVISISGKNILLPENRNMFLRTMIELAIKKKLSSYITDTKTIYSYFKSKEILEMTRKIRNELLEEAQKVEEFDFFVIERREDEKGKKVIFRGNENKYNEFFENLTLIEMFFSVSSVDLFMEEAESFFGLLNFLDSKEEYPKIDFHLPKNENISLNLRENLITLNYRNGTGKYTDEKNMYDFFQSIKKRIRKRKKIEFKQEEEIDFVLEGLNYRFKKEIDEINIRFLKDFSEYTKKNLIIEDSEMLTKIIYKISDDTILIEDEYRTPHLLQLAEKFYNSGAFRELYYNEERINEDYEFNRPETRKESENQKKREKYWNMKADIKKL